VEAEATGGKKPAGKRKKKEEGKRARFSDYKSPF